jgi:hypothetical protein
METDPPQGQPRRQSASMRPKVAVGNVAPCIVFLEAACPGEAPLLVVCWARSSSEVREVGQSPHLMLNRVLVLIGNSRPADAGPPQTVWHFLVHEEEHLVVKSEASPNGLSLSLLTRNTTFRGVRNEIKFIDQKTDSLLAKIVEAKPSTNQLIASAILVFASPDWPSLKEFRAFLLQTRLPEVARWHSEMTEGDIQYARGADLFEMGQYTRAAQELQLALKDPDVRNQAMLLIGMCFMKLGRYDLAAKELAIAESELLVMDNLKKETVYQLGLAYEATNHPDKALEQWKKIYEYDMSFRDVAKRVEDSYGGGEQAA